MKHRIVTIIAAAALAITSMTATTTPAFARSNEDQTLQWVLGLLALGVILNDIGDKDKAKGHRDWRDRGWNRMRAVPEACVYPLRSNDGSRNVVSSRCLRDFGSRCREGRSRAAARRQLATHRTRVL